VTGAMPGTDAEMRIAVPGLSNFKALVSRQSDQGPSETLTIKKVRIKEKLEN
jgi:hypothetical protein